MKLLVADSKKISYYNLPKVVEDYFMVDYVYNDIQEAITLVAKNGNWYLSSDSNVQVIDNGNIAQNVIVNEYLYYMVHFVDINTNVVIFVMPDIIDYSEALIKDLSTLTIGSSSDCNIYYNNSLTLPNHVQITKNTNYYILTALNNENGLVYVNNKRIKTQILHLGDVIFVNGIVIIWMEAFIKFNNPSNLVNLHGLQAYNREPNDYCKYVPTTDAEKNINLYNDNDLFFHTPHLHSNVESGIIKIDAPPEADHTKPIPIILSVGSSAVIGITSCMTGIYAFQGLLNKSISVFEATLEFVMCGLMLTACIIFPLLTSHWQKHQRKKEEKRRQEKYKEYLSKKVENIKDIINKQDEVLRENNLTLDEIKKRIINHSNTIWNRELIDDDFLTIRLGIGDLPADVVVEAPTEQFSLYDDNLRDEVLAIANEERKNTNVPITISIVKNRITPFIINTNYKQNYIDGIMLQLMYYYSGLDLKIVMLTNEDNKDAWSYIKYLPHCSSNDRRIRFFATNENEMMQISMYLEQEYDKRLKVVEHSQNNETKLSTNNTDLYKNYLQYYLIITDDYKEVKNLPIINRILNSNSNIGFSLMIIENSINNLPSRLEKFIDIENNISGIYNRRLNEKGQIQFKSEYLSSTDIDKCATLIANIPIKIANEDSLLPVSLSFLDMFNVGRVEQLNVLSRWSNNNPTTSLSAQIGLKENNKPITLDLHEKFHGPHGLIAGSTGSGKSEFIITYILSMAINYHPNEVQFVIIDYKGGGLAGAFENKETGIKLPHLIGTITNLDTSEMNRTLVSIQSEMKRRQIKFNEARDRLDEGTIDIYKYQKLYREGKVKEPIAHLFVISDEFAELKQQQPDFMDELVSTARIGRSLGVHLILATQKPSGVVDDQIWSNAHFKVCLKVQTSEDSLEMLKRPEASEIKETGRFYLQVGNNELFELGQSAWAGAKYIPTNKLTKKINDSIDFISNDGTIIKSINNEIQVSEQTNYGEQLTNIVKYLYSLAKNEKITPASLWLPNIPEEIYLGNLMKKYDYKVTPFNFNPIIGEYDKPSKQIQGLYTLNMNLKNSIIFGIPGSGKENLLSTLLYSTCISHSLKEVNFYILDFGSESLSIFNRLPQVGDFITSSEKNKVATQLEFLEKEIRKRKELFSEYSGNFETYCKESGKTVPLIVTILNSYESFMENCGEYDDYLIHLLREGSKYGIIFIVTAISTNSVRTTVTEYFANKIILQTSDTFDYQFILGAEHGFAPKKNFGRGMAVINEEPCEFQTAYITLKENINDAIRQIGKILSEKFKTKAQAIKIMPKDITFDSMLIYTKDISRIPVGFSRDAAEITYYDFVKNKTSFIIGNKIISDLIFIGGVIDLIDSLETIHLNIFDFITCVNTDGNMDYYNLNYIEPFTKILANNSTKYTVNIFLGIGDYKKYLTYEEIALFEKIMQNTELIKNQSFVFIDEFNRISKITDEPWYSKLNKTSGIWYGQDIDMQNVFHLNHLNKFDIEESMKDVIYVIDNNDYTVVKGIGKRSDSF